MIHTLSKTCGISKSEAAVHTELDFWEMITFENLDRAKQEWLLSDTAPAFSHRS